MREQEQRERASWFDHFCTLVIVLAALYFGVHWLRPLFQ